ncbi:LIC10301 family lipoprotein [Leptospira borgpetersenii]|uniref:Uncharacterized protein n=2 Tax=Leptospira borgpetersenii TaxID=174 RepID=A0A0E3B4I4_LEPBO|nr:hypothetical protein [Leptospira borgpetersenii]ALO27858.1 hypothetical protein LBBP_03685 [Leptospira borgpetersenii serovar Ballum]ANH02068.2 Uncharacterized protein LB4E_2888 [Leptospira borgpetersenii str. 4E]EKP13169.1 hypothetical protein LEP1GSC128_3980 [Leptospira borgpetersenii str. 200801926]EKR00257.1 hypothetical protein LEP1GSC121_3659 [Leptospira borgpetersenii serovar Castellonis str. 200801910]ENO64809.1 hypothetical protein LEP1GSC191_1631 [Leptospira borgpetersenii serovar
MFESMKKVFLIFVLIPFLFAVCKKKEELILGDWIKVKKCSEKGECVSLDKGSHLLILPDGLAKYDNFHLTYKMKEDDINFNLADLAFDLEYRILKVNEKELQLLNKKEDGIEYFVKGEFSELQNEKELEEIKYKKEENQNKQKEISDKELQGLNKGSVKNKTQISKSKREKKQIQEEEKVVKKEEQKFKKVVKKGEDRKSSNNSSNSSKLNDSKSDSGKPGSDSKSSLGEKN